MSISTLNLAEAQIPIYKQAFIAYQAQDFEKAEDIWGGLSDLGDPNAQYALGIMHQRGEAKDSSVAKAYYWLDKAAQQEQPSAMFNLGVALWEGVGVQQNKSTALQWWHKAAQLGDPGAQFNLGLAYYVGDGVEPDPKKTAKWLILAAEQNHVEAQNLLTAIKLKPIAVADLKVDTDTSPNEAEAVTASSAPKISEQTDLAAKDELFIFWKTSAPLTSLFNVPDNNEDASTIAQLPKDTPIEYLQEQEGWAYISLPDGLKLWIYNNYLRVEGDIGVVTGANVRARPHASTNPDSSPPVGMYRKGDELEILEQHNHWTRVRAPKHIGGWTKISNLVSYQDSKANRISVWKEKVAQGL